MTGLPEALAALAAYPQFVLYRKSDKLPCNPMTGEVCDAQDPRNHTDAATAYAMSTAFGDNYGVGFVLRASDPFVVFDADNALLPTGDRWTPESLELVAALPGAAVEVSTSGRGFHVWATASNVPPHRCKNPGARFEMYHEGRYIALGGHPGSVGSAAQDVTALLPGVIARWFAPTAQPAAAPVTTERNPEWRGPEDDEELLRRMLSSRQSAASVFGGKASIRDLWLADPDALAASFPPNGDGEAYDASSADMALAMHLAWWTGNDAERIERMMRASGLNRDKYDRADYLPMRTIPAAMRMTQGCYRETPADVEVAPPTETELPGPRDVTGAPFAMVDDQRTMWAGCVYVADKAAIIRPNGQHWKRDVWNDHYARLKFPIDAEGTYAKSPWEAFHGSQLLAWPKVDSSAFRPDKPVGAIFDEEGVSYVNIYRPLGVEPIAGDVSLFLDHVGRLLPGDEDRRVLLDYLAALIQYKGHKLQWAPFIQGAKGNGKSLLAYCVREALGDKHTMPIRPVDLASEYNAWLAESLFAFVEDTYVPTGRGKTEMMEVLKPMITAERQPIRAMRADPKRCRVCCNFLFFSNHDDGLPHEDGERRIAPLFCAQQRVEHLVRDGMTAAYFDRLWGWLQSGGYANVAHYLATRPIPSLDWFKGRAPTTSSTEAAVRASASTIEQEVLEAIASERHGFRGGWIAGNALDALLKELRAESALPRKRRRAFLEKMGYVWHPGLREGRATKPLADGGAKCTLYIREGHISAGLSGGVAITDAYEAAQGVAAVGFGREAA